MQNIELIKTEFSTQISEANSLEKLEDLRVKFLGKKTNEHVGPFDWCAAFMAKTGGKKEGK